MQNTKMTRRNFAYLLAGGTGAVALGGLAGCQKEQAPQAPAVGTSAVTNLVAGIDYKVLEKPVASSPVPGKVEVIEFFGYWCPHCFTLEPSVEAWRKQISEGIEFNRVPVGFGDPAREPLQKLYFALRDIDKLETMHAAVFNAVHRKKEQLYSDQAVLAWAAQQPELVEAQFEAAYNSFSMKTQIEQANQLIEGYDIQGVPCFGVAGKYLCDGGMAKSLERALKIAEALALQELQSLGASSETASAAASASVGASASMGASVSQN